MRYSVTTSGTIVVSRGLSGSIEPILSDWDMRSCVVTEELRSVVSVRGTNGLSCVLRLLSKRSIVMDRYFAHSSHDCCRKKSKEKARASTRWGHMISRFSGAVPYIPRYSCDAGAGISNGSWCLSNAGFARVSRLSTLGYLPMYPLDSVYGSQPPAYRIRPHKLLVPGAHGVSNRSNSLTAGL